MRAAKGDMQFTVGLCTSPQAYSLDNMIPEHIEAHLWVKTLHSERT